MKRNGDNQTVQRLLEQTFGRFRELQSEDISSACDAVLHRLRAVPEDITEDEPFAPARSSGRRLKPAFAFAAMAITAMFVVFLLMPGREPIARVDAAGGGLYRVNDGEALRTEEGIEANETVRANGGAGTVLKLADGSAIEMRSKSELFLERADDGIRIRLSHGDVIVNAAKQRQGHLYVQTKDLTVSVTGTVFLVNAEEEGSRVAVLEGEVRVKHDGIEKALSPGSQVVTQPDMKWEPLREVISWSRSKETHMALLQQSTSPPPSSEKRPAFEVASVRPSQIIVRGGARGAGGAAPQPTSFSACATERTQIDPARLVIPGTTVYNLVTVAYGKVMDRCITWDALDLLVGPDWIKSTRIDIEATLPKGTPSYSDAQARRRDFPVVQSMLQSLLADRFKLSMHREKREVPAYALTFQKDPSTLARWKEGDETFERSDPEGNVYRGAIATLLDSDSNGNQYRHIIVRKTLISKESNPLGSSEALVDWVSRQVERPVLDKTGLVGEFNLDFEYSTDGIARPTFIGALQSLGFKLESTKTFVDVWVIDHIERPAEN